MTAHDPKETTNSSTRPSRWGAVRFALKAIEIRLRFVAILVGIGLVIGYWETIRNHWDKWTRPAAGVAAALGAHREFYCPMHPTVIRPTAEPNGSVPKCPICGMPLSPRKKGEAAPLPEGVVSRAQFSPLRIEMAGIRTVPVSYQALSKEVRTVGSVRYDESRISRIVTRFSGYVETLYVNKTYETVARDQPLAEVYSPELYAAAQEFLIAQGSGSAGLVANSEEKLRLLGVDEQEVRAMGQRGKAEAKTMIRSPRAGQIIRKEIVDGSRIETGMTLFEVADLSVVWIEADAYEKDIPFLAEGREVEATVEAIPGRTFPGRISRIHPELDQMTRTNRVRFEIANPGGELRPGMYATVSIRVPVAELEPFRSAHAERRVSADAGAAERIASQGICPVTGAKLGSMGPPLEHAVGAGSIFLCCKGCVGRLDAAPETYLARIEPPPAGTVLAVPQLSVIDTGTQKVVYVEREPGLFDGIAVEVGPRSGEYYPVTGGLLPGDRVAAAGAFLIDAETRLNPAAGSTYFGSGSSPAGERPVSPATQPAPSSEEPPPPRVIQELARLPLGDQTLARQQRRCPVTGELLGSMGKPVKLTVEGQAIFLCCEGCEDAVRSKPGEYVKKATGK